MATNSQQAANAANAQLSTGPVTPEGKAASSQNARTHGLTARDLVIRDDEREPFQDLLRSFQQQLRPEGVLEEDLFDQLVHASWNLRRIRRLLAELRSPSGDALLDDSLDRTHARLARYHGLWERTYHRALRELKALQTMRAQAVPSQPRPVLARPQPGADKTKPNFPVSEAPLPASRPPGGAGSADQPTMNRA